MLTIYFCFPYRGVGGVSLLFLRVAEFLAQNALAKCHLVDYADGFMAKHVRESGVKLEVYEDDGVQVCIPSDAIAVFQSMTPWSIFPGIQVSSATRVFFWNCYPFNLVPLLPGLRRQMQHSPLFAWMVLGALLRGYRDNIRKLIALLLAKHSLVFMDRTNVSTTSSYLGVVIPEPVFVPIPLPASSDGRVATIERDCSRQLRVVWVGRIVDFKFYILHRGLIELNQLQPSLGLKISVKIVGSGDYWERLHEEAGGLANLQCEFIDHIAPQDMDDFLIRNADMTMAMGTSALESARLGIPTLLLDVAHAPVTEDYVFTWLHDRKGFTLGDVVCEEHFVSGNNSLELRIRELIDDFPVISTRARVYFKQHHELPHVAHRLLLALDRASCTYGDLKDAGLLNRGIIYSLFSKLRKKVRYS